MSGGWVEVRLRSASSERRMGICLLPTRRGYKTIQSLRSLTCSAESCSSNSIKAYCKLSPLFRSLTTSQLKIFPNLEKINSKSSSTVTGFNLQTNKIFSGGRTAAKGISPIISNVKAEDAAAVRCRSSSFVSSSRDCRASSVSAIRAFCWVLASGGRVGEGGGDGREVGSG
jgi:hypothetical protein